jgi:hypothetical protein
VGVHVVRGMLGDVSGMKRRMLAGEWYCASDPELAFERERCAVLVERCNATSATEAGRQAELLGQLLGRIGAETVICADGDTLFRGRRWRRRFRGIDLASRSLCVALSVGAGAVLVCPLLAALACVAAVLSVPVCAACPDVVVAAPRPRSGW